jgi:hypothetical protein
MSNLTFKLAQDDAIEVVIDTDEVPDSIKERFLNNAYRQYVNSRVNVAAAKYKKDSEADPTIDEPDYAELAAKAKADLLAGTVRERGEGGKSKPVKDPLISLITQAVIRDLFAKRRKKDKALKFGTIVKEVGPNGLEYLKTLAGDSADKLKAIETKYVKPARTMLGINAKGESTQDDDDDII